jgi:hypothetical protein
MRCVHGVLERIVTTSFARFEPETIELEGCNIRHLDLLQLLSSEIVLTFLDRVTVECKALAYGYLPYTVR